MKFQVDVLTSEEVKTIQNATLTLMENTGCDIYSEKAKEIFKIGGAKIEGNRVRFPRELVEKCIASAPDIVNIYDRNGNLAMELGARNAYFGPCVSCPNIIDPYTKIRRPPLKSDVEMVGKVTDALKNMDFVMGMGLISDKTTTLADIHEADALLKNTTKPVCTWAFNLENIKDLIEMFEVSVGGADLLREKPNLIVFTEPSTPLRHSAEALDKTIYTMEKGLPVVYAPAGMLGGTVPVTIAAGIVVTMAETLTALVLSQLIRPGNPFIGEACTYAMDMTNMQASLAPEMHLNDAAATQILREWGIPSFGLTGQSNAKTLDALAGLEAMMSLLIYTSTGANLNHDCGRIEIGMAASLPLLVLSDEIIDFVRWIVKGVEVNDETLALDLIDKVGPGGNFLTEKHTLKHFRKELCLCDLAKSQLYDNWVKDGKKTMEDRMYEKLHTIIENHVPEPMSNDKIHKIDEIVARAEARVAKSK